MHQTRTTVTLREAAERLGTSISSIRRRIRDGSLHAQMVPGQFGDRWEILLDTLEGLQEAPVEAGDPINRTGGAPPEGLHQSKASTPPKEQTFPPQQPPSAPEHTFAPVTGDLMSGAPPEGLRRGSTYDTSSDERLHTKPHQDLMEEVHGGAPEGLQSVPMHIHMETLRLLEAATIRAGHANDARDTAVDEARRLERQMLALQFELMNYRRALTEHAESLAQRETQMKEAEAKRIAAEQEALDQTARREKLEEELTTRPPAPAPPVPWWKRMFSAR